MLLAKYGAVEEFFYLPGDTGLRGPVGEAGIPGTKGDQGNDTYVAN